MLAVVFNSLLFPGSTVNRKCWGCGVSGGHCVCAERLSKSLRVLPCVVSLTSRQLTCEHQIITRVRWKAEGNRIYSLSRKMHFSMYGWVYISYTYIGNTVIIIYMSTISTETSPRICLCSRLNPLYCIAFIYKAIVTQTCDQSELLCLSKCEILLTLWLRRFAKTLYAKHFK